MMCGTEDPLLERTKKWEEFMKENCPNIKYESYYSKGEHNFFYWNSVLEKALNFFGFYPKKDIKIQLHYYDENEKG